MFLLNRLMHSLKCYRKEGMREEKPPRYFIETVADLADVPPERLDDCLAELKVCVLALSKLKDDLGGLNIAKAKFVWKDDGKIEGKIKGKLV